MSKKTTIYDIAKQLNLTAATISRALNNNHRISKKTKELVQKTAQEMNYEQNRVAKALKSGKSFNVGVIVPRIDNNFFGSIIRGIEEAIRPLGYHVIICQTHEDPIIEKECIDTLINAQVDGILISTTPNSEKQNFEKIIKKGIPLIFFDRKKSFEGVSSVTINDFDAGYKSTKHLIDQGYKRIAHFRGDYSVEIFKQRYLGYKQALLDSGLKINEDYIIKTKSNREDGKNAIKMLLKLDKRPDAIFSSSDFAALGAIKELKKQDINIPKDIGIVGFSNEPFTKFMELSISSVDQSPIEIGKETAGVFIKQINNNSILKEEKHIVLEPKLIIRASSSKK
ncbi:LacI family DNA-binding transcriptional regulator [Hyunsoonleella pacifica]|uniref:LacI family transcriptional regulator n=1 Tax=Hyunsoonleella pacifica TaxID=1080224 RepID=A0A4Q9FUF8_9FLAO|nr:LacI family DNA-binding transcriptional regulator [Hyunsoonleella pacifica]TBN18919.1 LacI family transcriptional regulator [Hyunsoonleella pacifica]GGD05869.1 LacI family transcriptional regulator [Hyunsoonleella pacifica]